MSRKKQRKKEALQTAAVNSPAKKKTGQTNPFNRMGNWLVLLAIVLPVIFSSQTMDATVAVRYIFFSGFLLLFTGWFFWRRRAATDLALPALNKWVFAAGLAYAVWIIASMTTAINYREGYYEGGRHLLNLIFLSVVMITVMKEENFPLKICKTLLIVSMVQSFVGMGQYYGFGFTEIPGANASPWGLMTNRNLFGSAQALLLPFVLFVLHRGSRFWKYMAGLALTGLVISLLVSQTRSAWLAGMVILIISLVAVLIFSKTYWRSWLIGAGAVVTGSALIIFLALAADSEGELKQSVKERTQSFAKGGVTNDDNKENVQERFRIWQKTLLLVKDKPLTGAGPGNWKINIPIYGSEGMTWAYGAYSPDRVHNVYLQVAAETGIPGAVFYFSMWVLLAVMAVKIIINPRDEEQRILIIVMLAGLGGLATDAMFSFPTERLEHTMYVLLMGGIILGSYANNKNTEKKLTLSKPLIIILALVALLNFLLGLDKKNFEEHIQKAKAFENAGMYTEMLEETKKGKSSFVTLGPDVGTPMELKTANALKGLKQYPEAEREIMKAMRYHPNSFAIWNNLGTIYTEQDQFDKAIPAYLHALQIAPNSDIALKNLAVNYFQTGKYKECVETLSQVDYKSDSFLLTMMNNAKAQLKQ